MTEQTRTGASPDVLPNDAHDHSADHGHVHGPNCQHDHHHHAEPIPTFRRDMPKVGRNDPCYCGSGKKFKKCHGV